MCFDFWAISDQNVHEEVSDFGVKELKKAIDYLSVYDVYYAVTMYYVGLYYATFRTHGAGGLRGQIQEFQTKGGGGQKCMYSVKKNEWKFSLFNEWSYKRVNLEWIWSVFTHFGVPSVITEVTPKWVKIQLFTPNSLQIHSKFTLL